MAVAFSVAKAAALSFWHPCFIAVLRGWGIFQGLDTTSSTFLVLTVLKRRRLLRSSSTTTLILVRSFTLFWEEPAPTTIDKMGIL